MSNPIQYTSRTFLTIMADINSDTDLVDKPDWWKRMIAGIGDVLSIWENASANQSFLRTAFSRRAVADNCQLIDYQLTEKQSSSGYCLFDILPAATLPINVSAAELAAITSSQVATTTLRFEARTGLTIVSSTAVTAYTDWVTATDRITVAVQFITGEKVRLTTSGVLPAGAAVDTDYYAIAINATTIQLATSRKNAYAGTALDFTDQGSGNHTIVRLSRQQTVYQQTSVSAYSIGTSDALTEWQEFPISRVGVQLATLVLTLNGVVWTQVSTFVNSGSLDHHYKPIFNTDGTMVVQFGDGTYGAIPGAFPIFVAFAYGGGTVSNVAGAGGINNYVGGNASLNGASNPGALTGGSDAESLEHAKQIAPMLLKARDRFVTIGDGVAIVSAYGGVEQNTINANTYGVLTCQVVGIATGGGNPSSGLRAAIAAELVAKSVLSGIDVHFDTATITSKAVTAAAKVSPGYSWAVVQPYFDLAWKLLLTETGLEIQNVYKASGIADAVVRINTIFSKAFAAADYAQITRLLDMYDSILPRDFGETLYASDVYTFIQGGVLGIDYFTTTLTLPIVCAADEITTVGALTLSSI